MTRSTILRITRAQVEKVLSDLPYLNRNYSSPMARLRTDKERWLIEVEHLELNGKEKLGQLLEAGRGDGETLAFEVECPTGSATRKQYKLRGLSNGTFAVNVSIRDPSAGNIF